MQRSKVVFIKVSIFYAGELNLLSCRPTEKGLVASIVVNIAVSTVVMVAGKDKSLRKALESLRLLHSTRTFPVKEEFFCRIKKNFHAPKISNKKDLHGYSIQLVHLQSFDLRIYT